MGVASSADTKTTATTTKATKTTGLPKLITTTSTTSTTSSKTTAKSTATSSGTHKSASNLPKVTSGSSTSSTVESASYSSSTISSTPITIPNTNGNYNIYHTNYTDGTVFIAFGSCLLFITLILSVVWAVLGLKAWRDERKEYQLRALEEKYQYDPFQLQNEIDDSRSNSDNDSQSDISEKYLKQKSSRMSFYSLGTASALNLLNPKANDKYSDDDTNKINSAASNFRKSMFISPTEILQQDIPFNNDSSIFDSAISTPKGEQTSTTQVIANPDNNNWGLLNDSSFQGLGLKLDSELPSSNENNQKKKNYRPPSAHLDQLLDQDSA